MKNRVFSFTNSLISIFLLLGILVFINIFGNNYFKRFDMTDNNKYSISNGTKETLKELPSNLVIKAYFSEDMPSKYGSIVRYAKDILRELKIYSGGKLDVEYINPSELNKEEKQKILYSGVRPIQVQVLKDDQYEIKRGYMGLVMYHSDKKEVIPVLQNISTLEYDLMTRLVKLTRKESKKVGILNFSESQSDISNLKSELGKNYEVVNVKSENGKFNKKVDMMMVLGGTSEPKESDLVALDQYLVKGNPLVFMVDRYNVDLSTLRKKKINNKLIELLDSYGIKIGDELIFDKQNRAIQVQSQQGAYTVSRAINFPFIPSVSNFNSKSPIVSSLSEAVTPFVSKLEKSNEKMNFKWLAKSSKDSYEYTPYNLNPTQDFDLPDSAKEGPFYLGGIFSGKFDSYFKDKELKDVKDIDIKESGINKKVVVFSDEEFVKDNMLDRGNLKLIQNAIDWNLQAEDLIEIRSKNVSVPKLKNISKSLKRVVKYVNIFLMPILIILLGLGILYKRKLEEGKVYE